MAPKMRNPVRSESEAFRLTIGGVVTLVVSALLGWLLAPAVGVAALVVVLVVALVAYLRAGDPDRRTLGDVAREPHPHGAAAGTRHVLVVANETLTGDELLGQLTRTGSERVEVDVLAPVLTSRLHAAMSDIDSDLAAAQTRLDRSLAWAQEFGLHVRGEVGDPSPTTAMEDELRDFGADEVIVVTHPRERETWQERGELERLRRELDVPVMHVMVGMRSD